MMMRFVRLACLALSALAAALIAGFFYAYYCTVMPGLAATDAVSAIKAMQGINEVVRNAVFAFSFFGTLAFGGLAILLLIRTGGWPLALALLGTAIYGLGAFMVTLLYSVPLNESLATIVPTMETAAGTWQAYLEPWMFWNMLRMVMSVLTLTAFAASFVMLIARAPSSERYRSRQIEL